jgi:hypothetical protein
MAAMASTALEHGPIAPDPVACDPGAGNNIKDSRHIRDNPLTGVETRQAIYPMKMAAGSMTGRQCTHSGDGPRSIG